MNIIHYDDKVCISTVPLIDDESDSEYIRATVSPKHKQDFDYQQPKEPEPEYDEPERDV